MSPIKTCSWVAQSSCTFRCRVFQFITIMRAICRAVHVISHDSLQQPSWILMVILLACLLLYPQRIHFYEVFCYYFWWSVFPKIVIYCLYLLLVWRAPTGKKYYSCHFSNLYKCVKRNYLKLYYVYFLCSLYFI